MYRALLAVILIALASKTGRAQIFNWQTGALIPGTEMVVLGPGAQLTQWNTDQKNLRFGDFSDELDLTGANFTGSWLENARFWYADLTDATFNQASLAGAAFNLAIVKGANFKDVTSRGFTRSQLATTDSFNVGDMQGIDLSDNDLSGWIFQSLDLTDAAFRNSNLNGATFHYAKLQNVDFTGATLKGAKMWGVTTRGFTEAQLATVGSDLQGIELAFNDLSGWNFQGRDLTNALLSLSDLADADFSGANLTNVSLHGAALGNANFVGATVKGVSLEDTTSRGFTREQFESTADFQAKDLQGIRLWNNNLTDWDFGGHNLSHAALGQATLTNASFVSANLTLSLIHI